MVAGNEGHGRVRRDDMFLHILSLPLEVAPPFWRSFFRAGACDFPLRQLVAGAKCSLMPPPSALPSPTEVATPFALPSIFKSQRRLSTTLSTIFVHFFDDLAATAMPGPKPSPIRVSQTPGDRPIFGGVEPKWQGLCAGFPRPRDAASMSASTNSTSRTTSAAGCFSSISSNISSGRVRSRCTRSRRLRAWQGPRRPSGRRP